jgi:hypothetical protein
MVWIGVHFTPARLRQPVQAGRILARALAARQAARARSVAGRPARKRGDRAWRVAVRAARGTRKRLVRLRGRASASRRTRPMRYDTSELDRTKRPRTQVADARYLAFRLWVQGGRRDPTRDAQKKPPRERPWAALTHDRGSTNRSCMATELPCRAPVNTCRRLQRLPLSSLSGCPTVVSIHRSQGVFGPVSLPLMPGPFFFWARRRFARLEPSVDCYFRVRDSEPLRRGE